MDIVMNIVVRLVAVFSLLVAVIVVLTEPVRAAAETEPFDGGKYVSLLCVSAALVILAGRCLGWW